MSSATWKLRPLRVGALCLAALAVACASRNGEEPRPEPPSDLPPGVLFEFVGAQEGDAAGREVASVGDVDGDGVPDLAVGSPGHGNLSGVADVYSGADGRRLHHLEGSVSGIVFGRAIAGVGDLDGDGHDDFVVCAPQSDLLVEGKDLPDAGSVYVYSGATGETLHVYHGGNAGEYTGKAAAAVGDQDGDGVPDFMFSAPGTRGYTGTIYIHSGASGELIRTLRGTENGSRYGWDLAGAGDVDGDGVGDILAGSPWSSESGLVNAGMVLVYSGATGEVLHRIYGEAAGDGFGTSVAFLGDLDGDGRAEIAAGAPLANPGGQQDAGSVFVFSGADAAPILRFDADASTSLLGFSVADAGDVDGDGRSDVIAGGQWIDAAGLYNSGSAFVYSGATGEEILRIDGPRSSAEYGFAVASAGDLDGDHRTELIIGAPGDRHYAGASVVVKLSERGAGAWKAARR